MAEQALNDALSTVEPISVRAIALQVGASNRTLYRWFNDLCKAVSRRFREDQRAKRKIRIGKLCAAVDDAVRQLHREGIYPSKRKVVELSGVGANIRDPEVVAARKAALHELGYISE
jgi:hypothetical protein